MGDAESVRFGSPVASLSGKSDYSRVAAFLQPYDPDEVGLVVGRGNVSQDYNWWVAFGTHANPGRPRLRHVARDKRRALHHALFLRNPATLPHSMNSCTISRERHLLVFIASGRSR